MSARGINQTYGADGASLVVAVPVALTAAWLWWRRSPLAPPLALGVSVATLYYAVASVMGLDCTRYSGNNERFFPLLLVLIVLRWSTATRAWAALDPAPGQPDSRLRRSLAFVLILSGVALGFAWLRQLFKLTLTGTFAAPADSIAYSDAPSGYWIVRVVDLALIVPISIATGFAHAGELDESARRAIHPALPFGLTQGAETKKLAAARAPIWPMHCLANHGDARPPPRWAVRLRNQNEETAMSKLTQGCGTLLIDAR